MKEIVEGRKYYRGEVYSVKLGNNGKFGEITGNVLAVIIQNDIGNRYSPTVIVAFIGNKTSDRELPTQMDIRFNRDSVIKCEQLRTISKERLGAKVGELTSQQINLLNDRLMKSLGLKWIEGGR